MKKRMRRLISSAAALAAAAAFLPTAQMSASAAGTATTYTIEDESIVHYTNDAEEAKRWLETDGDAIVILTGDTSFYQYDAKAGSAWATIGRGEKILDLDSHYFGGSIDFESGIDTGGSRFNLFTVPEGAVLKVEDSKGGGTIHFDGYLRSATEILSWNGSVFDVNIYRDIFKVEGGDLIYNGGEIDAGRSKEAYLSNARKGEVNKEVHFNAGLLTPIVELLFANWDRYDCDARMQVNCLGINMTSGSVTVNGGTVAGRGFSEVTEDGQNISTLRSAAIRATGGKLRINNGSFRGVGCADTLQISTPDAVIRAGVFTTKKIEKVIMPTLDDGLPRFIEPGHGVQGIPISAIASDALVYDEKGMRLGTHLGGPVSEDTVTNTAYDITIVPDKLGIMDSSYEYKGAIFTSDNADIYWDGVSDASFTVKPTGCWTELPLGVGTDDTYKRTGYFQLSSIKELGISPTITFGGMKVTEAGDYAKKETSVIKRINGSQLPDTMTFKLSDFELKDMELGDTLRLTIDYIECLSRKDVQHSTDEADDYHVVQYCVKTASYGLFMTDAGLKVTTQPTSQLAPDKGYMLTLAAAAEGADEAWWIRTYPSSARKECTSFDKATGTATLSVQSDKYEEYCCVFKSRAGLVTSNKAYTGYEPHVDSSVKDITLYTGQKTAYIDVKRYVDADQYYTDVKWTKNGEPVDPSRYSAYNTGTLQFKNITAEDEGVYTAKIFVTHGDTTSTGTVTFNVSVASGDPPSYITSLDLSGIGELYIGDKAPAAEDILCNDPRITVKGITWSGVTDGIITSANPSYTITCAISDYSKYNVKFDENGIFRWTMDGSSREAYGTANSTNKGVTLSYTYDGNNPVGTAKDGIKLSQTDFIYASGDYVDLQLDCQIVCPDRHAVKHEITSLETYSDHYQLPSGLTMTSTGHITGTITGASGTGTVTRILARTTNGDEAAVDISFNIADKEKLTTKMQMPSLESVTHIEHSYSAWTGKDGYHTRTCSVCGFEEYETHIWDEGEITRAASESADGEIRYTCEVCGVTKTGSVRYEGDEETVGGGTGSGGEGGAFSDVASGAYYFEPVEWAVANGITGGIGEGLFGPDSTCTRGQVVTFLHRAAGSPEPTTKINPFNDIAEDAYYYKSVLWALEKGITSGISASEFGADAGCTRAQVVTFLQRYKNAGKSDGAANPFIDVSESAYYYEPVIWAVSEGITSGTSENTFSPEAACTRAQIVTFLCRAVK